MVTRRIRILPSRLLGLAVLAAAALGGSSVARGYYVHLEAGNVRKWRPTSPATTWDDPTKTLTWHFNPVNFPQPTWPTAAQAGAAFENGYRTIQDVPGTSLKIVRGPDSTSPPSIGDGRLDMTMTLNSASGNFGFNIGNNFAVTWVLSDGNGAILDADVEVNGDPFWYPGWATTGPPAPANTNDIEATACHEQLHTIGGGHPVYYYSMLWPVGRFPERLMFDRDLAPDDRVLVRTLYPGTPSLRTISGTVSVAGGGFCDRAVVVATDSLGIPQATQVTNANGQYIINVPAGAGYTLTAHHSINSTYSSDISFGGATDFISSATSGAVDATTVDVTGVNFTVTGGTAPTMTLNQLGQNGGALGTQVIFLPKNSTGSIQLEITGATFSAVTGNMASLGPGITVGSVTVAGNPPIVNIPYTVAAAATAGVRNLSFSIAGGERLFLPACVEVLDTGSLTIAPTAGNPPAQAVPQGTANQKLLGFSMTASSVEDIRIRQLRFDLAGTGTLPAVRLWIDKGTVGTLDAADVQIFSGNAYANTPIAETLTANAPGTIAFDNLAVTIPVSGTPLNFLLTADMPASGSGSYTASLNCSSATSLIAHGMYYGDVITPTGGTITGGTQTTGPLAIGTLQQFRTTAGTAIPVGGVTAETQVTLRGVATSATGLVGMDVEVKPIGQAFSNTPSGSVAPNNASGATLSVIVGGLTNTTSYHWQARPVSSVSGVGGWVSFGGNSEASTDFSVDTSTVSPPTALAQFENDGVTPLPLGGSTHAAVALAATNGTSSAGVQVSLEVELQPAGTPFTNSPTLSSGFVASGANAALLFQGPTNDYHWQARSVNVFGTTSAWVAFNAAPLHFHLDAIEVLKADAGCIGRTVTGGPGWPLWIAAGLSLLAFYPRRRASKTLGSTLALTLCLAGVARAGDEEALPRSLADAFPAMIPREDPERDVTFEPVRVPQQPWLSLGAHTGFLFLDTKFDALGTDFIRRKVNGTGTALLGVEGLVQVHRDWRVGLLAEAGLWSDLRILSVGPAVTWRFSASHAGYEAGQSDLEHYARLAILYEKLSVTKQNFGDFDGTFGVRAGYELRIAVGQNWFVTIGAELQYSKWDYSPAVRSGDTSIGGFGGLISVGVAFLP